MFFFLSRGVLKLTANGHRVATAFLSGQLWLMLNKSHCNCQVQRIHSKKRLWIECIIGSCTVPKKREGEEEGMGMSMPLLLISSMTKLMREPS